MHGFLISETFPVFISHQQKLTFEQLLHELQLYKTQIAELLLKQGGLVLRGFPVASAKNFEQVIIALGLGKFVDYIGGDSPRHKITDHVYTSTEAPPNFHIPLHQELSFVKNFPHHIYFFCEIAPEKGGATIIGDARRIQTALAPNVKQRFQEKNLIYISHYFRHHKFIEWLMQRSHKSWIDVFETENKQDVEKKCREHEFNWQWYKNEWLEIKQTRPAVIVHPQTHETIWFNQAHLYDFNPRFLGWKNYIGAKLFYLRPSMRLHEVKFGDETQIPRQDFYHILDTLTQQTVSFPWQQGDVMILDNILTFHGRAQFSGKRRILTALTQNR